MPAQATRLTRDELTGRLEAAEQDLAAAQRALGEVELDGGDRGAAVQRVSDARTTIDGLQQALAAFDEREAREHERAERAYEVAMLIRACDWMLTYLDRARVVIELRPKLKAAEKAVMDLGSIRSIYTGSRAGNSIDWVLKTVRPPAGIPESAVADESPSMGAGQWTRRAQVHGLTPDRVDELLSEVNVRRAELQLDLAAIKAEAT